jgi:glucokinase
MPAMIILAGDIGGTKTNLGLFENTGGPGSELRKLDEKTVPTNSFSSPEDMMVDYVKNRPSPARPDAAAFGIAGPVANGVCAGENLPWKNEIRETSLAQALGVRRATLLNDLAATANGVRFLKGDQIVTLHKGEPVEHGTLAVIAAGTGLGEAGLVWAGSDYEPLPLEGGHTDLAVRNEEEIDLLKFLFTIERPVNQEAVLCGSGLYNVYKFLKSTGKYEEPDWLASEIDAASEKDKPGVVSVNGLKKKAAICEKALDLFVSMYGARAGNLAMTLWATGGLFIGGGIAPKNLEKLKDGTFMKAFVDKGFFRRFMEKMPVHVVLEQKTALIGAAQYAASHAG